MQERLRGVEFGHARPLPLPNFAPPVPPPQAYQSACHPPAHSLATVHPLLQEHLRDVEFVNASALPYPPYHRPLSPDKADGGFQGWKVKVFSVYSAPFQEVLYIDSDSTPLLDPTSLYSADQYRR